MSPRNPANPAGKFPLATYCLILAQLVVWIVVRRFLLQGGEWTQFALYPGAPDELGLIISPFIHIEPVHLGINLAVLWLFGTSLERTVGSFQFLFFYLGAAWFSSLMQWAVSTAFQVHPNLAASNAAVGSSGAVAGIMAAHLVRFPRARLSLPFNRSFTVPATPILTLWVVYTLFRAIITTVVGYSEGIGHWAHFGGFVFGLAMAQLMGLHHLARREMLAQTAEEAYASDNLLVAARAWSALLAMRPSDTHTRTALITTRLAMSDVPGARRLAREGLEALVKANDRPTAIELYEEYVELVPELDLPPGIRYRLGCWLADAGRDELAFRALWESVREDGATPSSAAALYRAGKLALERLQSPRHARQAWNCLLEQFPDSPWCDAARDSLRHLPA